jgi:hypothetical protein
MGGKTVARPDPVKLTKGQEQFLTVHADTLPLHLRAGFRVDVLARLAGPEVADGAVLASVMATLNDAYIAHHTAAAATEKENHHEPA